jgi:type I restriction enzyme S subunit
MIKNKMARYDYYKETDSPWFDIAPLHWVDGRIKDFVNTNTITKIPTNLTDDDLVEFIPMTNVNDELGKIKQFNLVPLKEVSSGYTKFKDGDVIFAKITPCMENGNCAIVTGLTHNICFGSTEFMVFRVFQKLTEKFLHYFLHNELFRRNAEPFMKGSAGQRRISSQYMATHYFALPPLPEQKAIADYLDTKTAQIDRKIDLLTQKATKYGKLKQSLINDTVTRGLDKTVAMKDSGVEWIGKVPENWNVELIKRSLKILTDFTANGSFASLAENVVYIDSGYARLIRLTDLRLDLKNDGLYVDKNAYKFLSKTKIRGGEILIANVGAYTGLVKLVPPINFKATLGPNMFLVVFKDKLLSGYIKYQLSSICCFEQFRAQMTTTAQPKLNKDNFRSISIVIPTIPEQRAITDYLDTKTIHIDRIIKIINTQISKLKELRKTLINDVVTGKIKVYQEEK